MGTNEWWAKASSVRANSAHLERTASGREDRTEGEAVPYQAGRVNLPVLCEILPNATIVSIGHRSTLTALHRQHIEVQPRQCGTFEPVSGAISMSRLEAAPPLAAATR